jgi:hypothetical protein
VKGTNGWASKRTVHAQTRKSRVVAVALALLSGAAAAQTKPVTVTITRVEQLGADFDSTTLGEFYADITINGVTQSTFGRQFDFPPPTGFIVPTGWMTPPSPWVVSQQVPFALNSVAVNIALLDDDSPDPNDPADLNPAAGNDIHLTVDLSTGKWSGDINWPQACVSGTGGNGAGICFDISILSATGDADADTLLDGWELNGYNDDKDESLDVDLPQLGANALRKDLFVELDSLVATTHTHVLLASSLNAAVMAFASAPVANPDGTSGVQLHIDIGATRGAGVRTPIPGPAGVVGTWGDLGGGGQIPEAGNTTIRTFLDTNPANGAGYFDLAAANFDPRRRSTFRYAISGHQLDGCTSGAAYQIPGGYFMVTLGGNRSGGTPCWGGDGNGFSVGTTPQQAGTFLHELGHTLGLLHGGVPGEVHEKPNYLSVMNYAFQMCTVPTSSNGAIPGLCDYSRIELDPLNETSLDECVNIDPSGTLGFGPFNWDGDNLIEGASNCQGNASNVVADTNRDGVCIEPGPNQTLSTPDAGDDIVKDSIQIVDGRNRVCNTTKLAGSDDVQATANGVTPPQPDVLPSFDDWANLKFDFSGGQGASGASQREAGPQLIEEAQQHLGELLAPVVTMVKTGPATALPGTVLTYLLELRNIGSGPALGAVLSDGAPPVTSNVGTITVGSLVTRSSTLTLPADACPGSITAVPSSLAFKDFAGRALTASTSAPLQILDAQAPSVTLSVSKPQLWPPNHKPAPITVTVVTHDTCDPNPVVRLISITSNEPLTAGDIAGAAYGTDDRSFGLRAERNGNGSGRVYTILYRVTDASANSTERTVTVTVAHDRGSSP